MYTVRWTGSVNLWERHFDTNKALRARGWKGSSRLATLAALYESCLSARLAEPSAPEKALRSATPGKHSLYLRVWCWNALAYQLYKFHRDLPGARRCLEEGLRLAATLAPRRYGRESVCVEAVWLIFLLNEARLDLREGQVSRGQERMTGLSALLRGETWRPELFGETFARLHGQGHFHFSRDPGLVAYLEAKLAAEAGRQSVNSKVLPS